ncbi:zinc-dependent metalloprotease [Pedobacter boryungensis]|uniref:Zinc-dependent metalloprotease n=1 Tax=Pedobacter boryungensis TaxID=869962 RepID=A0ABX2DFY2_9SPHI|nr:zinc-dependent metalloprotease [Pedobacter boryungensis]NQX32975.1 zinc-dependent metalloprotease [Pedobacter boryungensis]
MKRNLLTILLTVSAITIAQAQVRPPAGAADTTRRGPGSALGSNVKAQPKPYNQVITDKTLTRKGMITTHKLEDKFFFEIADTTLGRDILVVSRIAKSGADVRAAQGYAGDVIGSTVIRFEKGPNNRIFMRKVSFKTYSPDSTTAMYQSLKNSNIQAIAASFNIAAYTPDKTGSVIDVTDYINSDNDIFYFSSPASKTRFRLGTQLSDRSYIQSMRSFPLNVEISTMKTYSLTAAPSPFGPAAPAMGGGASAGSATIELNTSLVILPKVPMKARYADPRVGYFTVGYTDFDLNPQGVKEIDLIKRWRLEPKPQDLAKYKRGELVEPQKQIVYYIDPATPKKWVPYLIAGVNDWAKAFEKAGFKNAVVAKEAPTFAQDSTWSIDDARHSAIVYKPSEIANASGPSISDPRSGEIMESHINWFHNVQSLVHDWYMIQTAATDPRARKMVFSDELMGDLIRFVSSHEVGHTLGLLHNYGSSSTVPVENLRNKKWVEENGHTPSIMDYARFNYVAQPEDNITAKGLYPRIGDYDRWAIEWGYKYFPDTKTPGDEVERLNKAVIESAKNRRLWFGTESNPDDPHSQNEDLGDNAMKASDYGIKNLKVILPNLPAWTKESNEGYDNLSNMYGQLTTQFGRYMGHVAKNVGGIYENPKMVEQAGLVYERTPAATQKEAMDFLNRQLFTTPKWLLNQSILDNIDQNPLEVVAKLQGSTLNRLLSNSTLGKLVAAEAADGSTAYKITDLFTDLNGSIFTELKSNSAIDVYRRNLQKAYVEKLIAIVKPAPAPTATNAILVGRGGASSGLTASQSDVMSVVKGQLRDLDNRIKSAATSQADSLSKYHLLDLTDRIESALDSKKD